MHKDQLLWVKIVVLILVLLFVIARCNKSEANVDLKQYLKQECFKHELAKDYSHWENNWTNWERCYLIGSAQAQFETNWGKLWAWKTHNNIYWFRANWFMYFESKEKSIDWFVWHYYKYQRYKTIYQITSDSYYCSRVTWWCGWIKGFTYTKKEQPYYYRFVKTYFHKNLTIDAK